MSKVFKLNGTNILLSNLLTVDRKNGFTECITKANKKHYIKTTEEQHAEFLRAFNMQ